MAFVTAAISFNTFLIGKLPVLEGLAIVLHVFGFFAFIVIFWVMGPRAAAEPTFTHFDDSNGWGSLGLATLIGMVGPTTTYLGADSAVHLAEELKDASYVLPRAMFSAAIINYITGFTMMITFMFNLGDLSSALESATGQPWVAVLYTITGSKAAAIVLTIVMICMVRLIPLSGRFSTDLVIVLLLRRQPSDDLLPPSLCLRPRQGPSLPPLPLESPSQQRRAGELGLRYSGLHLLHGIDCYRIHHRLQHHPFRLRHGPLHLIPDSHLHRPGEENKRRAIPRKQVQLGQIRMGREHHCDWIFDHCLRVLVLPCSSPSKSGGYELGLFGLWCCCAVCVWVLHGDRKGEYDSTPFKRYNC